MASKGPRSKLDHDTRTRRQKALEAPKEPRRPKTHWDHVLEEMIWLSKDFESERKWKIAQAKKVALKASKGMVDQATKGERKLKEEEQRMRKIALNISKDVKKFWIKIEKLVLYKHQMELNEKKKKARDKQLEFLLGQTERYSTMLAENLVDKPLLQHSAVDQHEIRRNEGDQNNAKEPAVSDEHQSDATENGDEYYMEEDESQDDEHTIDEDEAFITEEERKKELEALHDEVDLPLEELLKRYAVEKVSRDSNPEKAENGLESNVQGGYDDEGKHKDRYAASEIRIKSLNKITGRRCDKSNNATLENHLFETDAGEDPRYRVNTSEDQAKEPVEYDFKDEQEDGDFVIANGEEKVQDDETTLSEEEELAKAEANDPVDEISLLQKESEIPLEELLSRYKKGLSDDDLSEDESEYTSASQNSLDSPEIEDAMLKHQDFSMVENVEPCESVEVAIPTIEEQHKCNNISSEVERESDDRIADAAAAARSAQPTGNTFSTTKVRTKFPFLLKYPLREYQHIGLDWLVTMYEKKLNGILADEMGLGKTIMTIALLAHLACEKGIWGPHLIVVPTSVMLNWETEFLKWCPAFKILTYFGSAKERKFKRQGWLKPNSFHVCITTYRLVIQDAKVFKRKKWKYLILDEAHLIKNWKSQRWQTLLNFNSKRRILLTGTPLQNDLMELWSLMHFLMPHIFQSHQEFKEWFSNPISGMVEGQERVNKEVVDRLHNVLRPFILRRLKRDVEKQLPMKYEHVIFCRLSKRQRNLYEDFIASSETQATLASSNFFGIISIIMQLRKVCNHPDLFEGRPIISSFDMAGIELQLSSSICSMLSSGPFSSVDVSGLGFLFTHFDFSMTSWESDEVQAISTPSSLIIERPNVDNMEEDGVVSIYTRKSAGTSVFEEIRMAVLEERLREAKERAESIAWWNSLRCRRKPMYSTTLRELVTVKHPIYDIHHQKLHHRSWSSYSSMLANVVFSPVERLQRMMDLVESFMFAIPAARAPLPVCWCSKTDSSVFLHPAYKEKCSQMVLPLLSPIRPAIVRRQVYFPDRRLVQFDCGKLQELAILLRKLKSEGHRALIFTQMTKMLDILEAFINLYGYTYMRLDGSTQPEERQTLMQRFNTNPKIFLFILSTRSGGVGINLVGADTVIFYDSDWNPAMDQQAQDRCHRIGQTREVHIYRLISESTIEENILKKANQKRALDDLVIQSGGYNTEFFKKLDPMELFSDHQTLPTKHIQKEKNHHGGNEVSVSNADVEAALKYAEDEADYMALKKVEQEEAVENQEFTEEAIGKLEDDEFVNDDDVKAEETGDQEMIPSVKDNGVIINVNDSVEEKPHTFAEHEDDADMLADVKQMAAAAAAAGQDILSFENQLRPIDRYAIRFLELWDPIINKEAMEPQVGFEETEWELEHIEKYKEEMEAEMEDDEEPFVYERWDTDFATEAYRQEVEALTQRQLMEELEAEARRKENEENGHFETTIINEKPRNPRPKSKKKQKKAKLKSSKKGSLSSELKHVKEEPSTDTMSLDDDVISHEEDDSSDITPPSSVMQRKRKTAELILLDEPEKSARKKSKKLKKAPFNMCLSDTGFNASAKQVDEVAEATFREKFVPDFEQKSASRSKMGGKISITTMPVKRVLMIKPEKLKKGNVWSRDCVPSPDTWSSQEDAVLSAVVHEYGPNWRLVSDTLYGMTAGGYYRGRYRHPVHCCERFRELIQKYILSTPDNPANEKASNTSSGKALLKVTEDNLRTLLNVAANRPDDELLLQKHFTALLSSVWRMKLNSQRRQRISSSQNGMYFDGRFFDSTFNYSSRDYMKQPAKRMRFTNLERGGKLLAAALHGSTANIRLPEERVSLFNQTLDAPTIPELLEITLEFPRGNGDVSIPFPSIIHLSIPSAESADPQPSQNRDAVDCVRALADVAESRFRDTNRTCEGDGGIGWASSAFALNDVRLRSASKSQSLGKEKHSLSDSIKPARSKLKKILPEQNELQRPQFEPALLLPPPTLSASDLNMSFDLSPFIQDSWIGDSNFVCSTMDGDELLWETDKGTSLTILDNYNPGLISGLDDFAVLPEYTDIG